MGFHLIFWGSVIFLGDGTRLLSECVCHVNLVLTRRAIDLLFDRYDNHVRLLSHSFRDGFGHSQHALIVFIYVYVYAFEMGNGGNGVSPVGIFEEETCTNNRISKAYWDCFDGLGVVIAHLPNCLINLVISKVQF